MYKNITLSAEEEWIARARAKATAEKSTLNELFRRWIRQYVERGKTENEIDMVMDSMDYVYSGKKFTRDELNER
jgi:metal-responsive CopG/Arc/MetJ family transcriptional regulator